MATPRFLQIHTLHSYPAAPVEPGRQRPRQADALRRRHAHPHIVPMPEEALARGQGTSLRFRASPERRKRSVLGTSWSEWSSGL